MRTFKINARVSLPDDTEVTERDVENAINTLLSLFPRAGAVSSSIIEYNRTHSYWGTGGNSSADTNANSITLLDRGGI
jgi:hypothetical protein